MPRTLWSGLPDATAPGTSISLGAVRSRSRPRRGIGRTKPTAPRLSASESCRNTLGGPEMAHGLYRIHFVLCLLLAADFVDVR